MWCYLPVCVANLPVCGAYMWFISDCLFQSVVLICLYGVPICLYVGPICLSVVPICMYVVPICLYVVPICLYVVPFYLYVVLSARLCCLSVCM